MKFEIVTMQELEKHIQRLRKEVEEEYLIFPTDDEYHVLIHSLLQIFTQTFGTENYETSNDTGFRENLSAILDETENLYMDGFVPNLDVLINMFSSIDPEVTRGLHPFFIILSFVGFSMCNKRSPTIEEFTLEIQKVNDVKLPLEYAMSFLEVDDSMIQLIFEKFAREHDDFNIFQWGIYTDDIFDWIEIMKIADV